MKKMSTKISAHAPGPVAVLIASDPAALEETIAYHRDLGFANIVVAGHGAATFEDTQALPMQPDEGWIAALNRQLPALEDRWIFVAHAGEYLYFPFCESRTIADLTGFLTDERREALFLVSVDLYPETVDADPVQWLGHGRKAAFFDRLGHYALDRFDGPEPLERQPQVHGGLRWRFAEHVPWERQHLDRLALFRARAGRTITADGRLSDAEANTIDSPWHQSPTGAVLSWRAARSLLRNPGSRAAITRFIWPGSERCAWSSTQLTELGFMSPGQWF